MTQQNSKFVLIIIKLYILMNKNPFKILRNSLLLKIKSQNISVNKFWVWVCYIQNIPVQSQDIKYIGKHFRVCYIQKLPFIRVYLPYCLKVICRAAKQLPCIIEMILYDVIKSFPHLYKNPLSYISITINIHEQPQVNVISFVNTRI